MGQTDFDTTTMAEDEPTVPEVPTGLVALIPENLCACGCKKPIPAHYRATATVIRGHGPTAKKSAEKKKFAEEGSPLPSGSMTVVSMDDWLTVLDTMITEAEEKVVRLKQARAMFQ